LLNSSLRSRQLVIVRILRAHSFSLRSARMIQKFRSALLERVASLPTHRRCARPVGGPGRNAAVRACLGTSSKSEAIFRVWVEFPKLVGSSRPVRNLKRTPSSQVSVYRSFRPIAEIHVEVHYVFRTRNGYLKTGLKLPLQSEKRIFACRVAPRNTDARSGGCMSLNPIRRSRPRVARGVSSGREEGGENWE
jgi:hypothetical protein